LAGCEAALQVASKNIPVTLYEQKPANRSKAHRLDTFAELVCSNSLKSLDRLTASGLLKQELLTLGCKLIQIAFDIKIPSGSALSVDRKVFSAKVTDLIKSNSLITVINQRIGELNFDCPTIIATGPLTDGKLYQTLWDMCGQYLNFFDAVSPIVSKESLDFDHCFLADRYDKTEDNKIENGSYINCPLSKDEYFEFYNQLINARQVAFKEWDNINYFEGCMPIEA